MAGRCLPMGIVLVLTLAALAVAMGVQELAPGEVASLDERTRENDEAHVEGARLLEQAELELGAGAPAAAKPAAAEVRQEAAAKPPAKPVSEDPDAAVKEQVAKGEIKAKADHFAQKPGSKKPAAKAPSKMKQASTKMTALQKSEAVLEQEAAQQVNKAKLQRQHEEKALKADWKRVQAKKKSETKALRNEHKQEDQRMAAYKKALKRKHKVELAESRALAEELAGIEAKKAKAAVTQQAKRSAMRFAQKKAAQEKASKKAKALQVSKNALLLEEKQLQMQKVVKRAQPKKLSAKQRAEMELAQQLKKIDSKAKLSTVLTAAADTPVE